MNPTIARIAELGQSIWCDYIRRGMIASGELQRLIDDGVVGITSNPTIFQKAIGQSSDYDADLAKLIEQGLEAKDVYEALAFEDIRGACDHFMPVYRRTGCRDGFVSLEVPPALADDTASTLDEAHRIYAAIGRPNVMIKVPATDAGIPAIEKLISDGINVNVTLIFSTDVYRRVVHAYFAGLERYQAQRGDLVAIASVASFFVSRVDTLVDKLLKTTEGERGVRAPEEEARTTPKAGWGGGAGEFRGKLAPLLGQAAVANAKVAYQVFKEEFGGPRFAVLAGQGARVQRPLWASTSTKNPDYPDLLYVDNLIGPHTVNTMPPATLDAVRDHGRAELTLEQDLDGAKAVLARLEEAGIRMADVTAQLTREGVKLFADSFDELMAMIESKLVRV